MGAQDDSDTRRLVELGLTGYEASAYIALTQARRHATASEAASIAELPRQRIYDVLEGLVAKGFATVKPGRPARYTAASPEEALWGALERRRAAVSQLEREIADTIERLTPAYREGREADDPLRFIELLREPAAIANRFAALEAAAEREILVFTKPPYAVQPAENIEGLELLERQIEARSVYERSIYDDRGAGGGRALLRRRGRGGPRGRDAAAQARGDRRAPGALHARGSGCPLGGLTIMIVEHPRSPGC